MLQPTFFKRNDLGGRGGIRTPEFLMCQIYSLVPIRHLSSSPKNRMACFCQNKSLSFVICCNHSLVVPTRFERISKASKAPILPLNYRTIFSQDDRTRTYIELLTTSRFQNESASNCLHILIIDFYAPYINGPMKS